MVLVDGVVDGNDAMTMSATSAPEIITYAWIKNINSKNTNMSTASYSNKQIQQCQLIVQ